MLCYMHINYKPPLHPKPLIKAIYYRQDLVPLLQSSIQRCSSIFFYSGNIYATVIGNIMLVHTTNYIESQTLKKQNKNKKQTLA